MRQRERTTLIGWQAVSVRAPADWSLAAVGGDRRKGSVRVADGRAPRLQVKWESKKADLARTREQYLKRLTVRRRKPTGIEASTDVRVISKRSKPRKELLTFAWRGPSCGMGVLWNCEVCGRSVIAQASWMPDEEGRETAQAVLESLDDHGTEGWDAWGVDGLVFLAPSEFELTGWKRMTRYLEMRFERGDEKLKVARWGMVPLVLSGRTVLDWYQDQHRRRRDVRWEAGEESIKGHEGVVARGERRRLAGSVRTRAARAVRRSPAVNFEAWAWHCPEANRLYLVEAVHGGRGDVPGGVLESVICHEEG